MYHLRPPVKVWQSLGIGKLVTALVCMALGLFFSAPQAARADSALGLQTDAAHSGFNNTPNLTSLTQKWSFNPGGTPSYPVIADGSDSVGRVFVIFSTPGATSTAMLYALSAANGSTLWGPITVNTGVAASSGWAALTYDAGQVFVVNGSGQVTAYNELTGAVNWGPVTLAGATVFNAAPVATGGRVFITGNNGTSSTVYSLNETTGAAGTGSGTSLTGFAGSPAALGTSLFIDTGSNLYGVGQANLATLLFNDTVGGTNGVSVLATGGDLIAQSGIYNNATGGLLFALAPIPGTPTATDGTNVWYVDGTGTLDVVTVSTGTPTGFSGITPPSGTFVTGPVIANGEVFVEDSTGKVQIYNAGTGASDAATISQSGTPLVTPGVPYAGLSNEISTANVVPGLAGALSELVVPNASALTAYTASTGAVPVTTATLTGTKGNIGAPGATQWYTSTITLTLSVFDSAGPADVVQTFYGINGPATTPYTGPVAINTQGPLVINYFTQGSAHIEANNTINNIGEDTAAPNTAVATSPTVLVGGTIGSPVQFTLTPTDATSGVATTTYTIDGGAVTPYTVPFTVSTGGSNVVTFKSTDVAGNVENTHNYPFTISATITNVNPNTIPINSGATSVVITGTNFAPTATATVGGTALTGVVVNGAGTTLTGTIPAAVITTAGVKNVIVTNPGNQNTNTATFTVTNLVPTLTSITPNSSFTNRPAFTMQLNGTGFITGATVQFGVTNLGAATFVNATTLTITVPAAQLTAAGVFPVTVTNPFPPTPGTSNSVNFTVNAPPAPTAVSLNPTSTFAGGPQFTITVTGTNFVVGQTVVNWIAGTTTVLASNVTSGTTVVGTVPAALITAAGSVTISVTTPGAGTSAALPFTINPVNATLVSLVPNPVIGGDPATTTSTGTVSIPFVQTGATTINLTSNNVAATFAANPVTIAAGQLNTTFLINTSQVGVQTTATIGVATPTQATPSTKGLVINPLLPGGALVLTPATIAGSSVPVVASVGTITLAANAPAGGESVTVAATGANAGLVAITGSPVVIAAGTKTGTFNFTTSEVAAATVVPITATDASGGTSTANLTITPIFTAQTVLPSPSIGGIQTPVGTVTLGGPAPAGGVLITLSVNNGNASVPASVTVPAGATSATYNVTTGGVSANVTPTVKATRTFGANTYSINTNFTITPPFSSFVLSPTTVVGGSGATVAATVTLAAAAPAAGLPISLASNNAAVTTAGTYTIPAGQTTFVITLTPTAVTTNQTVLLTLKTGTDVLTATLTVTTLIASNVLSPVSVDGGLQTSQGTVTLGSVQAGATTIALASNNAAATVPATVSIPAGQLSTTYTVTTSPVNASTAVVIGASLGGQTVNATLTVLPYLTAGSLVFSPTSVVGGYANPTGTVSLSDAALAPVGGIIVNLVVSGAGAPNVTVPPSVTIPAGSNSVTFTANTVGVNATVSPTVTATPTTGSTGTATATITLTQAMTTLVVAPAAAAGSLVNATGTITLSTAAPAAGYTLNLTATPAGIVTFASPTVTVASGQTTATFTITTLAVLTATPVAITATNGSNIKTAPLNVLPVLSSVTLNPTTVVGGVTNSTGTVTLNTAAPAGGETVALASNNTSAATVPASVLVPAGQTSVTFLATSHGVAAPATVIITATLSLTNPGPVTVNETATATLTVNNGALALGMSPGTVAGSIQNSTGTVTIGSPAPAGGITVTLAATVNGAATTVAAVPGTVLIPAGQTSVTFTATTTEVLVSTAVKITATIDASSTSTILTVAPILKSVQIGATPGNAATIVGTYTTTPGLITLNGPDAVAENVTVTASGTGLITFGATTANSVVVTVGAGQSTAAFVVSASENTTAANVTSTITASTTDVAGTVTAPTDTLTNQPIVKSVTLLPTSVIGGLQNSVATVSLNAQPPTAGGQLVTVTSSNGNAGFPPTFPLTPQSTTVTVPQGVVAGPWTATVTVQTQGVGATLTSTIGAFVNASAPQTAVLTITRPVSGLALSATTAIGGLVNVTGTVTIAVNATAPVVIPLSSTNTNAATVPASVTIPIGSNSATFTVTTKAVAANATTNIQVLFGSDQPFVTLTVTPQGGAFTLTPATIAGSIGTSTGTVTLGANAVSATNVTISAAAVVGGTFSGTPVITINGLPAPQTVTIAAGTPSVSFSVSETLENTSATNGTSLLTATIGTQTLTATLNISSILASVSVLPTSVAGGLQLCNGTVTLASAAVTPVLVNLAVTNEGAASNCSVPVSVTVPAGQSTATFPITTGGVGATVTPTITATFDGVNRTTTFNITRPISGFAVTPSPLIGGVGTATGTITLAVTPATPVTINVISSNHTAAPDPGPVTINPGSTTGTFTVTTNAVSANTVTNIQAIFSTDQPFVAITVTPLGGSLVLNPTKISSLQTSTGTVTLAAAAPAGGINVVVSAAALTGGTTVGGVTINGLASPQTINIPVGQTTATFTLNVPEDTSTTPATSVITATIQSGSNQALTATLTDLPIVASVALAPASVIGGLAGGAAGSIASSTGTVSVNAPAGGLVAPLTVNLAISNDGNGTNHNVSFTALPGITSTTTVTIAAGTSSTTFPLFTQGVSGTINALITATLDSATATGTLTVTRPISGFAIAPNPIPGGLTSPNSTSTGTVTIAAAAPAGGVIIPITSSNTAVATVPASVTVLVGATTATFPITALDNPNIANATSNITLAFGSDVPFITLTVQPRFASIALSTATAAGGVVNPTGTITLNGNAPTGGQLVTLSSNNPNAAVPNSILIPAGSKTGTFQITTRAVLANVAGIIITATADSVVRTATLTVIPPLASFTLAPATIGGFPGNNATGTVTLSQAAPVGGAVVNISSTNAGINTIPSQVIVNSGATTAQFTVTTQQVLTQQTGPVVVSVGTSPFVQTISDPFTVNPILVQVSFAPASAMGGIINPTGTVTISSPAPTGGIVVGLTNSLGGDTLVATGTPGPAITSVTVAAGATTATFQVLTSAVGANSTDTITASVPAGGGGQSITGNLTVTPVLAAANALVLAPNPIMGGTSLNATGTVTLAGAAPTGGVTLTLAHTLGSDTVPATVTVPAGLNSVNFSVHVSQFVPSPGNDQASDAITVSAPVGTGTATKTLLIDPILKVTKASVGPPVVPENLNAGITVNPTSVRGGIANSTGTITLSDPAPAGGLVIALFSNDPSASVAPTVTVAAGATTVNFAIGTQTVASSTAVTISASYPNGAPLQTESTTLTVTP